jgi:hypothetical protein
VTVTVRAAGRLAVARARIQVAEATGPEFPGTPRRYLAFSEAVNAFPPPE